MPPPDFFIRPTIQPTRDIKVPELTPLERLQPSLLDRLTDDAPGQLREPREARTFSARHLKACVLRDLAWLLNATRSSSDAHVEDFAAAARSTLNYGIPDLAGATASGLDVGDLARRVRDAIVLFEPRILPDTLRVHVNADDDGYRPNTLAMTVEGELWAEPMPLRVLVNTSIDLESGRVVVADNAG